MSIACVNVDLDSIAHYLRIHGLKEDGLPPEAARAVLRRACGRFCELFADAGIPATFFAVGKDLVDPPSAEALRAAFEAGHEIGNHSFSHDYDLVRRPADAIVREVTEAERAIVRAVGSPPKGFRAPGYAISAELLQALWVRNYHYDSSVFPAAPYYAAKAAVMGALALAGRPSRAMLDRPRVLLAPLLPYRPDPREPYRAGHGARLELPITVEPLTRMPFIGTTAVMLPWPAVLALYRRVRGRPFLNFELHGIDLLDERDLQLPQLARVQRDLRIGRGRKRERLLELLRRIADDFEVLTLARAAERLAAAKPA
jgi:peptidoglycan/xylan/chitin deacetylase (PgdA/CDA1 family)